MKATPVIVRKPAFPLVWIVPLLALLVGGWMIWREFRTRGPEITIEFADGAGIQAGSTVLQHKGVAVGLVRHVALTPDLGGVIVRVQLEKTAAALAREGAQFWLVQPEIGLSGIRGLDTLLTGVRINVRPGHGAPATHFQALRRPPAVEPAGPGRAFYLRAGRLGSLTLGAPVMYRELKVGVVEATRLAEDSTAVVIRIRIEPAYADLVRTSTRFWNSGGPSFRLGLRGAEIKSTSIETLLAGAIAFATPGEGGELAPAAPEGQVFTLDDESQREWLEWRPSIPISPPEAAPPAATRTQVTTERAPSPPSGG